MTDRGRAHKHRRPPQPSALYRSVIEESDPRVLAAAVAADGLTDELTVVRLLLQRHLTEHPENLALTLKGMHLLARMVVTQHNLTHAEAAALRERLDQLANHFAAAIFREDPTDG